MAKFKFIINAPKGSCVAKLSSSYPSTFVGDEIPLNEVIEIEESEGYKYVLLGDGVIDDVVWDGRYFDRDAMRWVGRVDSDWDYGWSVEINKPHYNGTLHEINVDAEAPAVEVVSPFNRLWYMDRDKLVELGGKMGSVYGPDKTPYNDAQFVIGLVGLPFAPDKDLLGGESQVKIGQNNTGVMAPGLLSDSIKVDLGKIVVGGLEGNALDYENARYELFMPWVVGGVELQASDVVGKEISIKYDVDVYKGGFTWTVWSEETQIESGVGVIGREIPIHLFSQQIVSSMGSYIQANNGLLQAYITVTKGVLHESMYTNLVRRNDYIGAGSGYVEVLNAELIGVKHSREVLTLLREGVIIKP